MMPTELSQLIQEFAKPRTRPDWKLGSNIRRTVGYIEFYWEMHRWDTFMHRDPHVLIEFYLHGWNNFYVNGAHMLMSLSRYGPADFFVVMELYERMTMIENFEYLVEDVSFYDDDAIITTTDEMFTWLFK